MAVGPSAKNLGVNNQIQSPPYAVFDGGLNVKDFWHTIADNELTVAQNIRLDEGGVVRMRGSWSKLTANAVGSAGNLIGLCHPSWLVSGVLTRYVVATDGTKVFWLNGASWTDITGSVSMSPANSTLVSFQSMNNLLIGYDGENAPWTWDGQAGAIQLLGGTPPVGNIGILWQNYWFVAGVGTARARLYFSDVGDPSTWPAINFIDVPSPYDGDPIMGLAILYGNLIVFKRNSIYIIQGTDPTTFVVSKTNAAVGCVSPYSVVSVENLVYFVSDKGLYALNLSNEKQICYKVQPRYDAAVLNQLSGSLARNQIQALNYRLRNEIWELADCTAAGQDQHDRTIAHNYNVVDKNGDPAVTEHFNYGSLLVTVNVNDTIDFTENGGGQVSATLTPGTYALGKNGTESGTLLALIKAQMQAAGSGTYTITYNPASDEITIGRTTGTFALLFGSGTHSAKTAAPIMGFASSDATIYSGVQSTLGVVGNTVTAGVNDAIDFTENGGPQLTCFLPAGTYTIGATSAVPGSLLAAVKTALQSVGAEIYTLAYDGSGQITVTSASGSFVFLFGTGTHATTCAAILLGFSKVDFTSRGIATGTVGVRSRALATNYLVCTAPSVLADYYSGSILPMASFYDKYVYVFNGTAGSDDMPAGSAAPIQLAFTSGYKSFGDATAVKTLRNVWTSLLQSGGVPRILIGVLGNAFGTESVSTLTPNSPSTFYNVKQPAGQIFGSSPQGKFFKFGFISNDGGAFSFFQIMFDLIWSGRRN